MEGLRIDSVVSHARRHERSADFQYTTGWLYAAGAIFRKGYGEIRIMTHRCIIYIYIYMYTIIYIYIYIYTTALRAIPATVPICVDEVSVSLLFVSFACYSYRFRVIRTDSLLFVPFPSSSYRSLIIRTVSLLFVAFACSSYPFPIIHTVSLVFVPFP